MDRVETNTSYRLISCDDHLDLGQLPADLWTSRMPAEYRDRAPHVEERDRQMVWVGDGQVWGAWFGKAPDPAAPKQPLRVFDAFHRVGIENLGQRRPGVAKLRLEDMDRDGVYAQLIFGPATVINKGEEGFREACFRAYNDWLAEYCSAAPDRLIGIPMLPETPEGALRELLRIAEKGIFRQANLQIAVVEPAISHERWEPFWNALEETGMILSFHVAIIRPPASDPSTGKPASAFAVTKVMVAQFLEPFVDLFAWGILERHPKMKIVIAESGLGWLPWIIQDLDGRFWRLNEAKEYWQGQGYALITQKPSEIFKRQVYVTFQDDEVAMHLLKFYGEDNLLWASDYPHPDSIWPHSQQTIATQMAHLSPELRKKLTHDNAARLYGLKI